jgi:PAS domain S-box-containing protein
MDPDPQNTESLKSDGRYRLMVEGVSDYAIMMLDPDGRITSWNKGAELIKGYKAEEILGKHFSIFYAPEDRAAGKPSKDLEIACEQGKYEKEGWHLRKTGDRFFAFATITALREHNGRLIGYARIVRDITAPKMAENALYDSQARLSAEAAALGHLNDLSSRLWRKQSINEGLSEMLVASIDLLGADKGNVQLLDPERQVLTIVVQRGFEKEFLDFFREVSIQDDTACGRTLRSGERTIIEDVEADPPYAPFRQIAKRAGYRAVQSTPLIGRAGKPLGMLSTHFRSIHRPTEQDLRRLDLYARQAADFIERCNDDVERVKLLERERAARAESDRANQLKDEFLAVCSHELRTPLTPILGWARMLKASPMDEKRTQHALDVIERNARIEMQLIEDLLDVSRIISGKLKLEMSRTDLVPVIRDAIESVRPAASAKGIRIDVSFDSILGEVSADAGRMQQVVWNLLSNAVKFNPRGGIVRIRLDQDDANVRVIVADEGEGIAPEFLPHMFERFRQADSSTTRAHGGLGLGLSIVKSLVDLHGGSVTAQSPGKGKGSTFTIELPRLPSLRNETTRTQLRHSAQILPKNALKGLRILIVDDEPDNCDFLTSALQGSGATVIAASSAKEALRIIGEDPPNVLISDIGMPDEDGYTLIRKVREFNSSLARIPAIAVTAYAKEEDRLRALTAGFQEHMAKPIEPAELEQVIFDLVNGAEKNVS